MAPVIDRAELLDRPARSDLHDRLYAEVAQMVGSVGTTWARGKLEGKSERFLRRQLLAVREAIDRVLLEEGC
jgi:hypothetical protein